MADYSIERLRPKRRRRSPARAAPHKVTAVEYQIADGAALGLATGQVIVLAGAAVLLSILFATNLAETLDWLHYATFGLFALASVGRAATGMASDIPAPPAPLPDARLPRYTVLVPLFREAEIVPQLIGNLCALEYPANRLQILLLLEADDAETLAAVREADPPGQFREVIVPPGHPRTKPRACNVGLQLATGELLVIYDAEDHPSPGQLREAAGRFAEGPASLACLQAPLRITRGDTFIARQFALEYAALFEFFLPALAAIGATFPLGGTSNHFKTAVLREVGGWDAYNVTEDADLGFRLARRGYRLSVISSPTYETPPETLKDWLPQRCRWVKGYMQTYGVHSRALWRMGWGPALILHATLGVAIAAAFLHGPVLAFFLARLLLWVAGGMPPEFAWFDLWLLAAGWCAAAATMAIGASRAGGKADLRDLISAPFYWALQSLAALHALEQLVRRPHHWDKTEHRAALLPTP
ncbi:MAG: glycosyltransferase family 2 protein [Caulobacteraceae bacterium]